MKEDMTRQQHWQKVYASKTDQEVSWYQEVPATSLKLIEELKLPKDADIIDVGGGNSNLTRELLKRGYRHLQVLDISEKAIERAKEKTGPSSLQIKWTVSDVLDFHPEGTFDLWHDRATFHFLTSQDQIQQYVKLVEKAVKPGGYLILASFSDKGPQKCSGLEITQYTSGKLEELFGKSFELKQSFEETHHTPFDTQQEFIYAVFQKQARN